MTHGSFLKSKLLIASLDRILTEYIMVMQVVKPQPPPLCRIVFHFPTRGRPTADELRNRDYSAREVTRRGGGQGDPNRGGQPGSAADPRARKLNRPLYLRRGCYSGRAFSPLPKAHEVGGVVEYRLSGFNSVNIEIHRVNTTQKLENIF